MTVAEPKQTDTPPKVTPAPDPLPPHWHRAIATSIATTLAIDGWTTAEQLRDIRHNPPGHHYAPSGVPGVVPNIEFVGLDVYAWGTIDPRDYAERGITLPAIAWFLSQLDLAERLSRYDDPAIASAGQGWLYRARRASVLPSLYTIKPNRHGNSPRFVRNDNALPEELTAFDCAVKAAEVTVFEDPHDYYDRIDSGAFDPLAVALFANRVSLGEGVL